MKKRIRLFKKEAEFLEIKPKKNDPGRNQARYCLTQEQINKVYNLRDKRRFVTTQEKINKNGKVTSSVKKLQDQPIIIPNNHEIVRISTNNTTGQQWVITKPKEQIETILDFGIITKIVKKHIKPVKINKPLFVNTDYFDRLVFTDTHIGMTPNENGFSLYGGKWDEHELEYRMNVMYSEVLKNKKGDKLYVDDLGDLLDGWDAKTVRRQHDLPQNMDNEKAFDVAVNFKVKLIDNLVNHYNEVILNNICEDNHSGSFGYVVNSTVKQMLELKYNNVKVTNYRKFINHYQVGNHAFVISHGKDSKNLKFGFKPNLDPKQIEKIDQYLKINNIYKNAEFIEFSKGDSHQLLLDYCSSDDFSYFNYPALSPASEWVQTNFKKGRSGFVFFNISYTEKNKIIYPYLF